uniref:restriction endonuclease subunit S n=1 Tax=Psychrobacter immobilis TaxID=498 RepID=UPI001919F825
MASDWTEVSLSELTTKITKGTTPTKKDGGFSSEGVNYIKSEAVTFDGRIDESKFTFISSEIHKKLKRSQLEESDILMSMAGIHLGKTAIVRTRHLPANTNQALALIRPIRNKIYPDYLFYFLQQSSVVYFINNSTSQSAQPNINLQEIGSLNIKYPEYNEQKAIAHILGSLDDKIELNRQMNETLEAMAQALFKSWFVNFDPVIDNALAAGNAIPDEFFERAELRKGIERKDNADIQKLFPDEFEFTEEIGWIPRGWAVGKYSDLAELNPLSWSKKSMPEEISYVDLG